jgi:kelch-like protein 10
MLINKVEEVDPTGPRAYHGTAVIGYNIYVVGGFDGVDYFNSCRCFNAETKTWKEIAPMNCRRFFIAILVKYSIYEVVVIQDF